MTSIWDHERTDRIPPVTDKLSTENFHVKFLQIWSFDQKNPKYSSQFRELCHSVTENRIHNLCISGQLVVPLWYQCVVLLEFVTENLLFIERTDYRSNLANMILFENCSCFSKIPFSISVESPRIFHCLISIPAGHWVRQIDGKSLAIHLADSFCQLYSALWSAWQEDPNDRQERCAMARTSCARLYEINFACEFAICSQYQNVEETEI